jgi:hypothetical protein
MSRYHHPPLRDVTADIENTAPSIVAHWTVFTELLPGNALLKSITKSFLHFPDFSSCIQTGGQQDTAGNSEPL